MKAEHIHKLQLARQALVAEGADGIRLRGPDWFAWATCGGDSAVLFSQEEGVAEILITKAGCFLLTNKIEEARARAELSLPEIEMKAFPWANESTREAFVVSIGKKILSDRPRGEEFPLPDSFVHSRYLLHSEELKRYRKLGFDAAEAVREALEAATPGTSEWEIAGLGAKALWKRGIHPLLTLVGGERRGSLFRHHIASAEKVGGRATLVVCGRRHGLFANLTRHVFFREPSSEEKRSAEAVALVEATGLNGTAEGLPLAEIFQRMKEKYRDIGFAGQELFHHQGGITGYLAREVVVNPTTNMRAEAGMAFAWNPSVPGAKIEDTFYLNQSHQLEALTHDEIWPAFDCSGRSRPDLWVRK